MRLVVAMVVCLVAGCSDGAAPADASAMDATTRTDAVAVVGACSDAIVAVAAVSCSTHCTTEVACDFTGACARPGCPVTTISCVSGRVSIYVSGIRCDTGPPSLDAGPRDASADVGDAGADVGDAGASIVHGCADARSMFAGRDCRFGCDAGGAPCDFTDWCCVQPSVFVGCVGGRVVTSQVGGDAGPCDWDASLDTATQDGGP